MSDDKKIIYSMLGVGKIYPPNNQVLRDISLSYFYGAKIGVLGLNGSGKSTLLRIMAGVDQDFIGETVLSPGYTVDFLPQEPELDESKTVRDVVEEGAQEIVDALRQFDELNLRFADPLTDDEMNALIAEQGKLQDRLDHLNAWDLDSRLELAMDALRCPPGDASIAVLSGGERRRVALCRLLLKQPDILLLDEPTNHLDAETVAWLERHLQDYPGTVIAVTHDRYFLDNVAGWILELDRGYGIPWHGNYSSWLEQKQDRLAREEKQESQRQKTLQRELEWLKMSPKAKQTKRKARINRYNELASQEYEKAREEREIYIPPGQRLGDIVIRLANGRKGYGDRLLYEDLTLMCPPAPSSALSAPTAPARQPSSALLQARRPGCRVVSAWGNGRHGLCRPEPGHAARGGHRLGRNLRRRGAAAAWQPADQLPRLRLALQLLRLRPAKEGRRPIRR